MPDFFGTKAKAEAKRQQEQADATLARKLQAEESLKAARDGKVTAAQAREAITGTIYANNASVEKFLKAVEVRQSTGVKPTARTWAKLNVKVAEAHKAIK